MPEPVTLARKILSAVARVGQTVSVLIDEEDNTGRALHQGPEVDGVTVVMSTRVIPIGEVVSAQVTGTDGIDLIAEEM